MKSVASALVLAALLMSLLSLQHWDVHPWLVAPFAVLVGVLAASTMQGGMTWIAVVVGAVSPLAYRWIHPHWPWLAIAALSILWSVPRIWLARTARSMFGLAAATLALSLLGGWIAASFAEAGLLQSVAACLFVGAALSLVPLLARTDTPIGHALEVTARMLPASPVRDALLRAADYHRTCLRDRVRDSIPATPWRKLLTLADRRASLQDTAADSVPKELDESIVALANELTRNEATSAPAPATSTTPHSPAAPPSPPPAATDASATAEPTSPLASEAATVPPLDTEQEPAAVDPGLVVNATVP